MAFGRAYLPRRGVRRQGEAARVPRRSQPPQVPFQMAAAQVITKQLRLPLAYPTLECNFYHAQLSEL